MSLRDYVDALSSFAVRNLHHSLPLDMLSLYHFIAGKSTIINTCLFGKPGVFFVEVSGGASHKEILVDTLKHVAGYYINFLDPCSAAMRVIKCHMTIFGQPPTVVLRVRERDTNENHAKLGSAARALAETGLRVVIDSSDNSLQAVATTQKRQKAIHVDDMPRNILEAIPELQKLFKALKDAEQADLVWAVLGGNPADYILLMSDWRDVHYTDVVQVAETYMDVQLCQAVSAVQEAKQANPSVQKLFELFRDKDQVPTKTLIQLRLRKSSPDKVLRVRRVGKIEFLVPATPAMALVLRYGEGDDPPSFDKLREVLGLGTPKLASHQQPQELQ